MIRKSVCVLMLLVCNALGYTQVVINGKVLDSVTRSPLAFVNVIADDERIATVTDIDGVFKLKSKKEISRITFSYIGYQNKTVKIDNPGKFLTILLSRKNIELSEVVIVPKENPAHIIIRKVQQNRKENNPENIPAFRYKSYNKVIADWYLEKTKYSLSENPDSRIIKDSTFIQLSRQAEQQHILVMESFTERVFYNGKSKETVLGNRVSGFSNPNFTTLATDIQPFSFYSDFITLTLTDVKDYINPIAEGSIGRYNFTLEDTIYQNSDTVFIISFVPAKGKNFNGLKGVLYINSNRYAIQNVIAEPAEEGLWTIKIQQMYEFVDNKHWFPSQLNYEWILPNYPSEKVGVVMKGNSYISDVDFSPEISKNEIGPSSIVFDKNAAKQNDDFWKMHRKDTLSNKEIKTYIRMDSLGRKHKFDYYAFASEKILEGYIPVSIFDFSLEHLFKYNTVEGIRAGLGFRTNEKLTDRIALKGFFGYGFWDKQWKYGGGIDIYFSKEHEISAGLSYDKDYESPGLTNFYGFRNTTYWNAYLMDRVDFVERYQCAFGFRAFRYLKASVSGNYQIRQPAYYYYYVPAAEDSVPENKYGFTEINLGLRYAYKEKLIDSYNNRYSMGTNYPVLYFSYTHGFKSQLGGMFHYDKAEFALEKNFMVKYFGETSLLFSAGYIWNDVPYMKLFKGRGSYSNSFVFYFPNSFQTMRVDEFAYDKYVSLHLKHSFGNYLFRIKNFKPEFSISQGILYGEIAHRQYHGTGIDFNVPDKWFFESGLIIDNLLRLKLLNLVYCKFGGGVFYRYGYYSYDRVPENFAFKISLKLSGSK